MAEHTRRILPERIETERLRLRAYRSGDGRLLYAAGQRNREHLARFEAENLILHFQDETQAESICREMTADWQTNRYFFLGIFEKVGGLWVGQIYVELIRVEVPVFGIGYVLDVDHLGKGYMTEALRAVVRVLFENLNAHRVQADCHEANERSWRVLERCGFQREGHLRENRLNPDGTYHGDYLYGVLRQEFTT